MKTICTTCGNTFNGRADFCPSCGTRLERKAPRPGKKALWSIPILLLLGGGGYYGYLAYQEAQPNFERNELTAAAVEPTAVLPEESFGVDRNDGYENGFDSVFEVDEPTPYTLVRFLSMYANALPHISDEYWEYYQEDTDEGTAYAERFYGDDPNDLLGQEIEQVKPRFEPTEDQIAFPILEDIEVLEVHASDAHTYEVRVKEHYVRKSDYDSDRQSGFTSSVRYDVVYEEGGFRIDGIKRTLSKEKEL